MVHPVHQTVLHRLIAVYTSLSITSSRLTSEDHSMIVLAERARQHHLDLVPLRSLDQAVRERVQVPALSFLRNQPRSGLPRSGLPRIEVAPHGENLDWIDRNHQLAPGAGLHGPRWRLERQPGGAHG